MDRKLRNTLLLLVILLLIVIGGGIYAFWIQKDKIAELDKKLEDIRVKAVNSDELKLQLASVKKKAAEFDSVLALRKFNVPMNLSQIEFFNFINKVTRSFSPLSKLNIEYVKNEKTKDFYAYIYKLNGTAEFNDLYKLIYAIEESKQLKKIKKVKMKNFVEVDDEEVPHYLVSFTMIVHVYFSDNDRFASSEIKENRLRPNPIYNVFYPLIRNEIPPNTQHLLDVQTARLLALVPDGAFLSDADGNTYLLWEGDEVYLGYLTKIDFDKNEVHFILNKGGIIEKVTLTLENEQKPKSKK